MNEMIFDDGLRSWLSKFHLNDLTSIFVKYVVVLKIYRWSEHKKLMECNIIYWKSLNDSILNTKRAFMKTPYLDKNSGNWIIEIYI